MNLAELITKAAKDGLLDTLALYQTKDGFQANAKRTGGGWQCVTCTDPGKGLEEAVRGLFGYSNQPDAKSEPKQGVFA